MRRSLCVIPQHQRGVSVSLGTTQFFLASLVPHGNTVLGSSGANWAQKPCIVLGLLPIIKCPDHAVFGVVVERCANDLVLESAPGGKRLIAQPLKPPRLHS